MIFFDGVKILETDAEVRASYIRSRSEYGNRWKAQFGFPVPVELLDRWWPIETEDDTLW
jgi:hypothetical protein